MPTRPRLYFESILYKASLRTLMVHAALTSPLHLEQSGLGRRYPAPRQSGRPKRQSSPGSPWREPPTDQSGLGARSTAPCPFTCSRSPRHVGGMIAHALDILDAEEQITLNVMASGFSVIQGEEFPEQAIAHPVDSTSRIPQSSACDIGTRELFQHIAQQRHHQSSAM